MQPAFDLAHIRVQSLTHRLHIPQPPVVLTQHHVLFRCPHRARDDQSQGRNQQFDDTHDQLSQPLQAFNQMVNSVNVFSAHSVSGKDKEQTHQRRERRHTRHRHHPVFESGKEVVLHRGYQAKEMSVLEGLPKRTGPLMSVLVTGPQLMSSCQAEPSQA